jgi:tetratricopeptide (TPR) repeat protein
VVSPLSKAVTAWRDRQGDAAREYALRRELESLGPKARSILIAASFGSGSPSSLELEQVTGLSSDGIGQGLGELQRLFLMPLPKLIEDDERFEVNANTRALVRRVYEKDDEYERLDRSWKHVRGNYPMAARGAAAPIVWQAALLLRQGEPDKAIDLLDEALVKMPAEPALIAYKGDVYSGWPKAPRVTDAREHYQRAYELRWNGEEMFTRWMQMEESLKEWNRAAQVAEHAHKRCRMAKFAYLAGRYRNCHGRELRQSAHDDKAMQQFRKAATLFVTALGEMNDRDPMLQRVFVVATQNAQLLSALHDMKKLAEEWRERLPGDGAAVELMARVEGMMAAEREGTA